MDLMRLDWQNISDIVKALTDLTLRYPGKRIVVWDDAGWHKSKKLREHLGEGDVLERIHLINMPPCSPDKNPVERVWGGGQEIHRQPPARRLRGRPQRIRDLHQEQ